MLEFFNVISNIIRSFFQDGVWVIGFFFLLDKTYKNSKISEILKVIFYIVIAILLINSILQNV